MISIESQISKLKQFAAKRGRAEQSRRAGLEKLEIVLSASAFWRGGRKGGSVFALPPAEPVNKINSDFFKYIPPVGKSCCWLTVNPSFLI